MDAQRLGNLEVGVPSYDQVEVFQVAVLRVHLLLCLCRLKIPVQGLISEAYGLWL